MPTQIIDTSLHVAAIPAAYTGPGNLVGNSVNSQGKDVYGNFLSAGNVVQINAGSRRCRSTSSMLLVCCCGIGSSAWWRRTPSRRRLAL